MVCVLKGMMCLFWIWAAGWALIIRAIASRILPPMVHWSPVFSAIVAIGWGLSLAGLSQQIMACY